MTITISDFFFFKVFADSTDIWYLRGLGARTEFGCDLLSVTSSGVTVEALTLDLSFSFEHFN